MSLSEELSKLQALHERGALSDEEYQRAKARLLDGPAPPSPVVDAINQLRRSADDRWIGGVCGGLARATELDSWVWRLGFALLFLFGGTGLLIYLLMWLFVPLDQGSLR